MQGRGGVLLVWIIRRIARSGKSWDGESSIDTGYLKLLDIGYKRQHGGVRLDWLGYSRCQGNKEVV
jgi:hypothetical protein